VAAVRNTCPALYPYEKTALYFSAGLPEHLAAPFI
jgi:hypothetical protein